MQQQQLRFSQTHTKRNGDTLHNDWKKLLQSINVHSQLKCTTRLYKLNYNNKNFVHNYPFQFSTLRFIVPLDTCGSWDGGPAAPPLVGPGCNWQALLYKEVHSVLPFLRNFFRSSHLKAFYLWRFERRAVVKIAEIVIVLWSDGCKQLLRFGSRIAAPSVGDNWNCNRPKIQRKILNIRVKNKVSRTVHCLHREMFCKFHNFFHFYILLLIVFFENILTGLSCSIVGDNSLRMWVA